jgi:hypothetical protein
MKGNYWKSLILTCRKNRAGDPRCPGILPKLLLSFKLLEEQQVQYVRSDSFKDRPVAGCLAGAISIDTSISCGKQLKNTQYAILRKRFGKRKDDIR